MKKPSFLLSALSILFLENAAAQQGCDTLFFRNGRRAAVTVISTDKSSVRYHRCGDPDGRTFEATANKVDHLRMELGGLVYLEPRDAGKRPPWPAARPFRFRAGIGRGGFYGLKAESTFNTLRQLGFQPSTSSSSSTQTGQSAGSWFGDDPLFGDNFGGIHQTGGGYTEKEINYDLYAFWVDGVILKKLLVGVQRRQFRAEFRAGHTIPLDPGPDLHKDYLYHPINFRTKTALFEPKLGWISPKQYVAFYGGPSIAHHRTGTGNKKAVGVWGGAEFNLRGRRKGWLFFRAFAEYHRLPKLGWPANTFTKAYDGKTYTSQFPGAKIDLSFFTMGFGTGFCF